MSKNVGDLYDAHILISKRLRNISIICILTVIFICAFGGYSLYKFSTRPYVPLFIVLDELDNIVLTEIGSESTRFNKSRIIENDITEWLSSCRTVTYDVSESQKDADQCSSKLLSGSKALKYVSEYYKNSILKIREGDKHSIEIKVSSILKDGSESNKYSVDWFEETRDIQKQQVVKRKYYRATLTIVYKTIEDERLIRRNPLGSFIDYLAWTEKT